MGFTLKDEPRTLCDSCRSQQKTRFQSGRVLRVCMEFSSEGGRDLLREPVMECSMYEQVGKISKEDAFRIGWTLKLDAKGEIGFVAPGKRVFVEE